MRSLKKRKVLSLLVVVVFACCGFFIGMGLRELWLSASNSSGPAQQTDPDDKTPIIYVDQRLVIPVPATDVGESQVISKGILNSSTMQIALTFDSGWLYDQTTALLDVLDEYQVKSTFFLRGLWVQEHPDLARSIYNRGHTLGNHSLVHDHMRPMSEEELIQDLTKSTQIIAETTGYRPYLFRPPYGEYNSKMLSVLGQQGYPYTVLWTLDSYDWQKQRNGTDVTAAFLIDRVLSNASNNGIILMHVGGYETVGALPEIITGLTEQGYTLVRVTDMLPPPACDEIIYTVKKGDTLYSIAKTHGTTVEAITAANNLD